MRAAGCSACNFSVISDHCSVIPQLVLTPANHAVPALLQLQQGYAHSRERCACSSTACAARSTPRISFVGDDLGVLHALSVVRLGALAGQAQLHEGVVGALVATGGLVAARRAPHGQVLALIHVHPQAAALALHG